MTPHDGPCAWVSAGQGGPTGVYRCACGRTRELAAAQPELDRRAALQRQADADKALRAAKLAGQTQRLPWFGYRRPRLD